MSATPEKARVNPAKEGRATRYASLDEVFQRYGTPAANQALVRRIAENADITGFVGYRTYFRIERRGEIPALEVHPGYTNGFLSESDVVRLAGDAERWPSRRFHGAWGVTHPVKQERATPAPRRPSTRKPAVPERVPEVCPTCFMEMPLTGVCATCG